MRTGLTLPPRLRFMTEPAGAATGAGGSAATGAAAGASGQAEGSAAAAGGNQAPADGELGDAGKQAIDRERAKAAKAERELAALRKQVEDSTKSAEQKAADDLKAAHDAVAQATAAQAAAELRALKYEVAQTKGLDLALAARLTGSTKAELEADADALLKLIPGARPGIPKPDRSQGGGSGGAHDPREAGKAEAAKRFGSTKSGKD